MIITLGDSRMKCKKKKNVIPVKKYIMWKIFWECLVGRFWGNMWNLCQDFNQFLNIQSVSFSHWPFPLSDHPPVYRPTPTLSLSRFNIQTVAVVVNAEILWTGRLIFQFHSNCTVLHSTLFEYCSVFTYFKWLILEFSAGRLMSSFPQEPSYFALCNKLLNPLHTQ